MCRTGGQGRSGVGRADGKYIFLGGVGDPLQGVERTAYEALQQVVKHEKCQQIMQLRRDLQILQERNRILSERVTGLERLLSKLVRSIVRANYHMVAGRVARAALWLHNICTRGGSQAALDRIWTELGQDEDEELV